MSPTTNAEIVAALERLRREGAPQELTVSTALPGRTHRVRLSFRQAQYIVIEADVGPVAADFSIPEFDAIVLYETDGSLRATTVVPADMVDLAVAQLVQYLAERADYLEYQIAHGADER